MRLPRLLQHFRRSSPLERMVQSALREGVGLHRGLWRIDEMPVTGEQLAGLARALGRWLEEEMSRTRRPYGIDQMAVGIACAPLEGPPIATASFGVFRPRDYYATGGAGEQIAGFVEGLPLDKINEHPPSLRLAATLFSWGDLARATVFKD